jgi:ubiquinone/menaquinone biosynthesis C-methylase UbiE
MTYSMEAALEAERLEEQVYQSNYSIVEEMNRFQFKSDELVLDAGCGTGVLSRYLVEKLGVKQITAVDGSDLRIGQAKKLSKGEARDAISFYQQDLSHLDPKFHGKYDTVICRYVLEHCPDPIRVIGELKKALKKGGRLIVVDLDGVFINLYTANKQLNQYLEEFQKGVNFDLNIGKKLPSYFQLAGFSNIEWEAEQLCCQGNRLKEEYINTEKRLAAAAVFGAQLFGSTENFQDFTKLYLEEMMKPENTLVFTKYFCIGKKLETTGNSTRSF